MIGGFLRNRSENGVNAHSKERSQSGTGTTETAIFRVMAAARERDTGRPPYCRFLNRSRKRSSYSR